jgi:hypothetical protein
LTFQRKGITYHPFREAIRKFSSFTLAATNLVVSIASAGGKDLAFVQGYDFGDVFYYFEGGGRSRTLAAPAGNCLVDVDALGRSGKEASASSATGQGHGGTRPAGAAPIA